MTTQEVIDYYVDLLQIPYNSNQQNRDFIAALVKMTIMDQLPLQAQNAFNVNTAIGKQLDVLGKYVGAKRSGIGLSGPITLNDDDFRVLIQLAILRNAAGSSLYDIQELLHEFFPDEIFVFDYQNMHMSYLIDTSVGNQDLIQLAVSEGFLPKPMGVQLGATIYAPNPANLFGFRTYQVNTANNTPFNNYDDYQMDWPWLSYTYAIISSIPIQTTMTNEQGIDIVQENGGDILL